MITVADAIIAIDEKFSSILGFVPDYQIQRDYAGIGRFSFWRVNDDGDSENETSYIDTDTGSITLNGWLEAELPLDMTDGW